MAQALKILIKLETLVNHNMDLTRRYPKHLRPTLGKRLDDHWITALIIVSKIRYSQPQRRLDYIHDFNENINTIRILIRLSKSREAISNRSYQYVNEKLDEIGRMLHGLRQYTQQQITNNQKRS
jgi:hypothetical protein